MAGVTVGGIPLGLGGACRAGQTCPVLQCTVPGEPCSPGTSPWGERLTSRLSPLQRYVSLPFRTLHQQAWKP